jgi:hypothetical protein
MGDMMGDASKEESPEDVFRHGRRSPDVGCCRVVAVRKTCLQIADRRNGRTFTGRKTSTNVPQRVVVPIHRDRAEGNSNCAGQIALIEPFISSYCDSSDNQEESVVPTCYRRDRLVVHRRIWRKKHLGKMTSLVVFLLCIRHVGAFSDVPATQTRVVVTGAGKFCTV